MGGMTSQVPASALVAALEHTERATRLTTDGTDLRAVMQLEPYWEAVRAIYKPFESGIPSPTGRVYDHEIPGGQLSNLRQQAIALGLGERFEQVEEMYAAASRILGRPTKVTPSSKVVGDLALHLVAVREESISAEDEAALATPGRERQTTLNRLLFPKPTAEFDAMREEHSDVSVLPTADFLYGLKQGQERSYSLGKGVTVLVELQSISDPDAKGMRTVMASMNGQLRPVRVRDRSVESDVPAAERADRANPGHVAAPFAGTVQVQAAEGDEVSEGDTVATIEAMKMEASITATKSGTVQRVVSTQALSVEGGDLVLVIG